MLTRLVVCFSILAVTTATACSTRLRDDARTRAEQLERNPGGGPPVREVPGLRDPANRTPDTVVQQPDDFPGCRTDIVTFVRAQEGNSCATYLAEIAGR